MTKMVHTPSCIVLVRDAGEGGACPALDEALTIYDVSAAFESGGGQ